MLPAKIFHFSLTLKQHFMYPLQRAIRECIENALISSDEEKKKTLIYKYFYIKIFKIIDNK